MEFKTASLQMDIRIINLPEMGRFHKLLDLDLSKLSDSEYVRENNLVIAGKILNVVFEMNLITKISGEVTSVEELNKKPHLFYEMTSVAFEYFHTIYIPEKKTV
jgi:hypothetical protein